MGKINNFTKLDLCLENYKHPLYIGKNLLDDYDLLNKQIHSTQVCVVTNSKVGSLYLPKLQHAFSKVKCEAVILDDGEQYKDERSLWKIYDKLLSSGYNRDTTVIALGGGVIGDISAFAASTYQRGVRLLHIPTSLLAQVDSSIGGKTAINHKYGKNMIGSFYHPHAVITDVGVLDTLPNREFCSGFAEIIKYALLEGGDFLYYLLDVLAIMHSYSVADMVGLDDLIAKCCMIKAKIVAADAKETNGVRQLLNLGHTFAHALETMTNYRYFLHGEAVAIGLYSSALLSYHFNLLSMTDVDFIETLLKKANLPTQIPDNIDLDLLKNIMLRDKKVKNNTLPFVLMRNLGDCYLEYGVTEKHLDLVFADLIFS